MGTLTPSARIYLTLVVLSAIVLTAALSLPPNTLPAADPYHLAFVVLAATLAYRFPVSFGFKRRIYLDVIAIASAVMLLEPGPAALAIGAGAVLGQCLKARIWDECAFNTSQAMLQTLAGGLLLAALDWDVRALESFSPASVGGLAALLIAIFGINSLLLAGIIGLQSGISPLKVLLEGGTSKVELAVQATQVAAAVVTALLILANVWLTAFVLAPCVALYLLLQRNVQKQKFAIFGMLETLADLVDYRDPYTATHTREVTEIARRIATEMALPREQIDLISMAARFHNLGSLTISGHTIETVGRLHSDEWNVMRQVPAMSADLLSQFPETALAGELVKHHLERYDGEGYPDGLAGEDIPLGSRIIAIADSLDAMKRPRSYRPAMGTEELRCELERYSGSQWDPAIITTVLAMVDAGTLQLSRPDAAPDDGLASHESVSRGTIEQQIQHQAFHDPLTNLPNRLLLMNWLSRRLTGGGERFAVLFVDLDGFKAVNDEFSHRTGDQVLIETSRRLRGELSDADLLARLGGDEFVALLPEAHDASAATGVAERMIAALAVPFPELAMPLRLAASVGIALAQPGTESPDEVLHRADSAMYTAKRAGRGRVAVAADDAPVADVTIQAAG